MKWKWKSNIFVFVWFYSSGNDTLWNSMHLFSIVCYAMLNNEKHFLDKDIKLYAEKFSEMK